MKTKNRCAVHACDNDAVHYFPSDRAIKNRWLKATKIPKHKIVSKKGCKEGAICNEHFTPNDYYLRKTGLCLRRDAVPSLFPWSQKAPQSFFDSKRQLTTKTYSRSVHITVVEQHMLPEADSNVEEDPLKIPDCGYRQEYHTPSPHLLLSEEEPVIEIDENNEEPTSGLQHSEGKEEIHYELLMLKNKSSPRQKAKSKKIP